MKWSQGSKILWKSGSKKNIFECTSHKADYESQRSQSSFPPPAALTFAARPSGFRSVCVGTGRRLSGSRRLFGEADEEDARVRSVEDVFAVYRLYGAAGQLRRRLR